MRLVWCEIETLVSQTGIHFNLMRKMIPLTSGPLPACVLVRSVIT
jgi:hypothetical protein